MNLQQLTKVLPKIELHAHLNGSLSEQTLKQLECMDDNISGYQSLTTTAKISDKTETSLQKCFKLFKFAQNATNNPKSVYIATKNVIKEFYDDNVIYLEIRTTPRAEKDMTKEQYIEAIIQAIKEIDYDIIVKLILSIDRRFSLEVAEETMDVIVKMKKKYPDIIKGVDWSGDPHTGEFHETVFTKARKNGLFVTMHCAEIKNDEENLRVLQFRPDRLGHGTCLHPRFGGCAENWNLLQKLRIPVECCITSNMICETTKNYNEHHIEEFIKEDLPFCLGTDDKGVFGTTLSEEYYKVAKNYNLTINDLFKLTLKSITYTFASEAEKAQLKKKMELQIETIKQVT